MLSRGNEEPGEPTELTRVDLGAGEGADHGPRLRVPPPGLERLEVEAVEEILGQWGRAEHGPHKVDELGIQVLKICHVDKGKSKTDPSPALEIFRF